MSANFISMPNNQFRLTDNGRVANTGKLYIGKANTDPTVIANQITVTGFAIDGTNSILTQPINLDNHGFPLDGSGNTVTLSVDSHYSLAIFDAYNKLQQSVSAVETKEVSSFLALRTLPVLRDGQSVKVLGAGYGDFVGKKGAGVDDGFTIAAGNGFYWQRIDIPFYSAKSGSSTARSIQSKLREIPSIYDWDSDSANDDSTRFTKALSSNADNIFIPSNTEIGALKIANIDVTRNVHFWGTAIAGYRQVGASLVILDGADYGFNFSGASNSSRLIGGGMTGISLLGQSTANKSDFVRVLHASSLEFSNVSLRQSAGSGFVLQDFMESRIVNCYFNSVGGETKNVIHMGDYVDSAPWNVNNLHIEGCTFGSCGGYLIYASENSNADLIWISSNKFEWDSDSLNPNTTDKSVIYLGKVERVNIDNNGFVYYYPAHSRYTSILELSQNTNYGVQFKGNSAWGCTNANYWKVSGGSLLAVNNRSNASMTTIVTSPYSQDIEPPAIRTSTGNRPTSYAPKSFYSDFIPAHRLTGPNDSNNFVPDPDATVNGTCQQAAVGQEIRRLLIPKDLMVSGRVLKVSARVKNTDTVTDGNIQLILDGNIITNNTHSLVTNSNFLVVPANEGWVQVDWYITPTLLGTGAGSIVFKNVGSNTFLFDGVSIKYAEFFDVTVPWTPGTIAANTLVNTTITSSRFSAFITGVSGVRTDQSLGGAFSSAYFNAANNQLVIQLRAFESQAASTATSFRIRLFLK